MSVDSSSTRGLTASRVLHSRLAWCITLSVLLAVALPLAVLTLLGGQALESLTQRFASRERLVLVRTVAQQVGTHLGDARALMAAWPGEPPMLEPGANPLDAGVRTRLPGLGMQFRQAALVGADGRLRWSTEGWPGPLAQAATALPRPGAARSQLLAHERNGQLQLVLAQAPRADGTRWLAELSPDALWQSVAAGDTATYWCVQNAQGLRLHCPAPAAAGGDRPGLLDTAIADRVHIGWTLPLDADFGAGDWQFDMVQMRAPTTVLGPALTGPLVGGALCALFGVLLASGVLIRRTLGPLQRLQRGTRQLEQRAPGVRVDIAARDEFGALAQAFNEMAGAVDTQFQSLELLASIDRDIVGHRAVDEVFRRVLVQALPGLGATVMGLARVESARVPRLHLQWNDEAFAHKVRRSVRALAPQEVQALLGVTVDSVWQPSGSSLSSAWCAPMRQDKDTALQALPLRWQGRTHGLLLLGWTTDPPLQRLREAAELRDRLSVALAAHQRELELTWQARHDDLTGLLNRNGLHQELDALLAPDTALGTAPLQGPEPALSAVALAVLFIDLDHFKTVNDNLGHGLGDELLRQAAERLEACAPTRAVAARPGGDEFVLVLPGADDVAAIEVASAVCRRMAVPFSLGGKEHFLGASIGIALAPVHGDNRTDLLRHADMAMYTAKDAGRGRHAMFEEPLDARLLERSALLADLRQAAARKELVLHYQPRVCVTDGRIVSAEALIRWRHPTRGLLAPGVFIPLAEESDLIEVIGLWVIRAACAQLARWRREGVPLQRLSVNVSPRQLQSGRLMEDVETALVQHGVPWNMLELEVTESLLVGDARLASEQLGRLRERGVLIALDDFGTGYSSMATLRNLPIDVMKVDRAFVQDLSEDPSALAVTRAILTLAQALGKHTVAEGIETQAQADTLRQLGCDEFQGFLFSKAVPAAEFAALCRFSAQQPVATSG
ncbi:EAL domain-containing protein [Sphaerotilus sp.]|uniref:putative bifunctional diguanylate cyclase/phosphodiesterase n=1 Tax=Sphaerotilus sp. TaxID=2093942 RepID=UPI00286EA3C3|nr:EAL domain-containing protein [Sphaerotilus sp.]